MHDGLLQRGDRAERAVDVELDVEHHAHRAETGLRTVEEWTEAVRCDDFARVTEQQAMRLRGELARARMISARTEHAKRRPPPGDGAPASRSGGAAFAGVREQRAMRLRGELPRARMISARTEHAKRGPRRGDGARVSRV